MAHPNKKKILRKIYRTAEWHYFGLGGASERYSAKDLRILNRSMLFPCRKSGIDKLF